MKKIIKQILKEEASELKNQGDLHFSIVVDDILQKEFILDISERDHRYVTWSKKLRILDSYTRFKKVMEYFEETYGITSRDEVEDIMEELITRWNFLYKNYSFLFEHRMPYLEYPISLYQIEDKLEEEEVEVPRFK
jgi:hypothetical protein